MFEFKNVIWAVIIGGGGLAMALKLFEFEKVIWVAFLSVFTLTATAFFAMCIFVIGSHVGFANTSPSWGDVFTFGAILVASIIAFVGWKRAEKNQREIWDRTDEKQKEASSRNAAVQVIILYAEFKPSIEAALEILEIIRFSKDNLDRVDQQLALQKNEIKQLSPEIEKEHDFNHATPLLRDDLVIGQNYLGIIEQKRGLRMEIQRFLKTEDLNIAPPGDRKFTNVTDQISLAAMAMYAISLLKSIDDLRIALQRNPFAQNTEITSLSINYITLVKACTLAKMKQIPLESDPADSYSKALEQLSHSAIQELNKAAKEYDKISKLK